MDTADNGTQESNGKAWNWKAKRYGNITKIFTEDSLNVVKY